ncbi:MAG: PP2C family protein-serine/threonine phosphatase [Bythopirellula sp.]
MPTTTTTQHDQRELNCMEVWGGNGTRENHFVRPGIDIWLHSQAIDANLSGSSELYLLSSCSSGRITRMMVADVCGHLPHYEKLAEELRELMKQNINTIRQARLVNEISRRLAESSEQGCFATTMIGTFFSPRRSLSLCNTGNPPPLLYNAQQQAWSVLKQALPAASVRSESWGVTEVQEYQQFETRLNVGDLALCVSNPITECRTAEGQTIGMDGILHRAAQLDPADPAKLIATMMAGIKREHPENLAVEDATVLLCQGTQTSVAWKDNLLAPLRFFQSATDKTSFE